MINPTDLTNLSEVALRLGAAALVGGILGINRDLHQKPAGLRVLALVSLGSALIVTAGLVGLGEVASETNVARIIQGIFSGIGFLGAGVILRGGRHGEVYGITTATSIWLAAGLGSACGLGLWKIALTALVVAMIILVLGLKVERFVISWVRTTGRFDDEHSFPGNKVDSARNDNAD
jgi:putative Mg2+ transporter-C (MgtC) family protein